MRYASCMWRAFKAKVMLRIVISRKTVLKRTRLQKKRPCNIHVKMSDGWMVYAWRQDRHK